MSSPDLQDTGNQLQQQANETTDQEPSNDYKGQDVDAEPAQEYLTGLRLLNVFLALILTMLLAVMDMTIMATAIPHITDEFHSVDDIGWYASVFFMTVASSQSMWGKVYRYFDLKAVFLVSIALFELGSLLCAVAPNSNALIVGRAITGLGAAGVIAGCYTIAAFAVPPEKRPAFTGALAGTYGIGSSIAPVIRGVLADRVTWRWCFYINLPIGGVATAIIVFLFQTPAISRNADDHNAPWLEKLRQMDFIGFFTILPAVTCLLLALFWGGVSKAWKSSAVIGTLVGFFVIIIAFVAIEYAQGDRAMVVPRIFRQRVIWVGCIVSFLLFGGQFTLVYYVPIYFQAIVGVSAEHSGVLNLAYIIPITLGTIATGGAIAATGQFTPFMIAGSALITIAAGLISTFSVTSTTGARIGYQVLAGFGVGLCCQAPILAAQALAPPIDLAATTAMLLFFQTMGGEFMVSAAQSGFTNTLLRKLVGYAPGIDVARVLNTGAAGLHVEFKGEELKAILASYTDGLQVVFAIVIALTGAATLAGLAMPWKSIKTTQKAKDSA